MSKQTHRHINNTKLSEKQRKGVPPRNQGAGGHLGRGLSETCGVRWSGPVGLESGKAFKVAGTA